MRRDPSFDLQIAEGAECISEFCDAWDDLFVRAADAPPFLSRSWMRTFVEEGRLPGTPLFVLARSGTKLVALFPLAIRRVLNIKIAVSPYNQTLIPSNPIANWTSIPVRGGSQT